jgi:aminoglycoside 6-adenylyltransferase
MLMSESEMRARLVQWGEAHDTVRAMLLTSTRVVPNAALDIFSDYDVILILTDIHPFAEDRGWLEDFGHVLTLYRDPILPDGEFERSGNVIQYEDGLKIDFTLWPIGLMQRIVAEPQLPDELDAGYRILLDKDHLTDGLKPPTYQAYIPKPPTERAYVERIEGFFLEAIYVAKLLWRNDLMAAKHIMDGMMKQESLLSVLEWRSEIDHDWSVKPGPYGRRLKQWLRTDLWAELEATYTGGGLDANWDAMLRTIALFRRVAIEVGDHLGYAYPHDLDRRVMAYLQKVRQTDRGSEVFS